MTTMDSPAAVASAQSAAGAQPLLEVVVYGHPAPQGSKRHVGGGVMVESSKHVKPWREDVRAAALACVGEDGAWVPLDGPLRVEMVFTLRKPASAPKRRRTWPIRYPDASKLARSTEDALTSAGVYRDDAQIVDLSARKVFPGEDRDALASPGAVIRVWPISDGAA